MIYYIGLATSIMAMTSLMFLGSISTFYSLMTKKVIFLQIGRIFDGFTCEFNEVLVVTAISYWFKGKIFSFAVSLYRFNLAVIATSSVLFTVEIFQKTRNIDIIFFIVSIIACFSSICSIIFQFLDLKRERVTKKYKIFEEKKEEKMSFGMFRLLDNLQIWSMIVVGIISTSIYFSFIPFTTEILTNRYPYTVKDSSNLIAVNYISIFFSSPIFGFLTVKFGKKIEIIIFCYIMLIFGFFVFYFLSLEKSLFVYIPFITIGLFFGILNALVWSGIALVTPERATALALCITTLGSNVMNSIFSFIFGEIVEDRRKESYRKVILIMIFFASFGLIMSIFAFFQDRKRGGLLGFGENGLRATGIKKIIDFRGNRVEDILRYLEFTDNNPNGANGEIN